MNNFNEAARNAYENYLMGHETCDHALKKMIPGSKYYDYLKIIDSLKEQKGKKGQLPDEIKDMIKRFKKKHKFSSESNRVDFQSMFIEFDNLADDKAQQKKLLEKLSGPKYLKLGLKLKKSAPDGVSEGEKSEEDEEKKRHELVYSHEDHYKDFLKKIENETTAIEKIHPSLLNRIDYKALSDTYFKTFLESYPYVCQITNESFLVKAAELLDAQIKKRKSDTISMVIGDLCGGDSSSFYQRFTLEQLMKFAEILPKIKEDNDWHGSVFQKKFYNELDPSNRGAYTLKEKFNQLKKMYQESEEMPTSFRSVLLLELLVYGRRLDICYKEYFAAYIKNPVSKYCMKENIDDFSQDYSVWGKYYANISARANINPVGYDFHKDLIFYYLEAFYRSGTDLTQYQSYIDKYVYSDMITEIKLLNGEEISHETVDMTKFDNLGNKVLINILESNPTTFKMDDTIKILCDLKNTPTVYIKIYEFNAENYYRSRMSEFDSTINLDGLEPTFEKTEEFKEAPLKKFRHLFEFPEISKKAGLFVIDFFSNGFSSRAIIKIGSLSFISHTEREGNICYVLDENRQICKNDTTAVWFNNKYFKANDEGKIVIPFEERYSSVQIVLLNKGVAELSVFSPGYENYSLF